MPAACWAGRSGSHSARRALDFLRAVLWRDARLLATFKDGRAHLNAYLDDHAFLLAALLESMQADFRRADLDFAVALADVLLTQFEDRERGGFFFTSHDHEQLILRPKPAFDNATPSGNGVAALALQRLGHLVGEPRYLEAAERTMRLFYPQLIRHPGGFSTLCIGACRALRSADGGRVAGRRTRSDTLAKDACGPLRPGGPGRRDRRRPARPAAGAGQTRASGRQRLGVPGR